MSLPTRSTLARFSFRPVNNGLQGQLIATTNKLLESITLDRQNAIPLEDIRQFVRKHYTQQIQFCLTDGIILPGDTKIQPQDLFVLQKPDPEVVHVEFFSVNGSKVLEFECVLRANLDFMAKYFAQYYQTTRVWAYELIENKWIEISLNNPNFAAFPISHRIFVLPYPAPTTESSSWSQTQQQQQQTAQQQQQQTPQLQQQQMSQQQTPQQQQQTSQQQTPEQPLLPHQQVQQPIQEVTQQLIREPSPHINSQTPQRQQQLTPPALQQQLSPALQQQLASPALQQQLTSPALQQQTPPAHQKMPQQLQLQTPHQQQQPTTPAQQQHIPAQQQQTPPHRQQIPPDRQQTPPTQQQQTPSAQQQPTPPHRQQIPPDRQQTPQQQQPPSAQQQQTPPIIEQQASQTDLSTLTLSSSPSLTSRLQQPQQTQQRFLTHQSLQMSSSQPYSPQHRSIQQQQTLSIQQQQIPQTDLNTSIYPLSQPSFPITSLYPSYITDQLIENLFSLLHQKTRQTQQHYPWSVLKDIAFADPALLAFHYLFTLAPDDLYHHHYESILGQHFLTYDYLCMRIFAQRFAQIVATGSISLDYFRFYQVRLFSRDPELEKIAKHMIMYSQHLSDKDFFEELLHLSQPLIGSQPSYLQNSIQQTRN